MKVTIYVLIFMCLSSGCDYFEEKYYGVPVKQLRRGKTYKEIYSKTLKELEAGIFDEHFDFEAKRGEGSVGAVILASEYKFRFVPFLDIKDADWQEYELGMLEAIDYYFRKKYGEHF